MEETRVRATLSAVLVELRRVSPDVQTTSQLFREVASLLDFAEDADMGSATKEHVRNPDAVGIEMRFRLQHLKVALGTSDVHEAIRHAEAAMRILGKAHSEAT